MVTPLDTRLYKTEHVLTRPLRVAYPAGCGRVVLRVWPCPAIPSRLRVRVMATTTSGCTT